MILMPSGGVDSAIEALWKTGEPRKSPPVMSGCDTYGVLSILSSEHDQHSVGDTLVVSEFHVGTSVMSPSIRSSGHVTVLSHQTVRLNFFVAPPARLSLGWTFVASS